MGMGWKRFDLRLCLKAHVIIAVCCLRFAPRVNHVNLRGDLIAKSQPRLADHRYHVIGIITCKTGGIPQRNFFKHIPDAVIGSSLGKVIAHTGMISMLFCDNSVEMLAHHV